MCKMKRQVMTLLAACVLLTATGGTVAAQDRKSQLNEARRLNEQVVTLYDASRYDEAIALAERMLALYEKVRGPGHPDVAATLNLLAESYSANGDYAHAEPLFQRALAIWESALPSDHPDITPTLENLASLYLDKGDYVLAEPLYLRSLAIDEKAHGKMHPNVATDLNNLAALYMEKGDHARAEQMLLRALAIREKVLSAKDPLVALSLNNLAWIYHDKGDYDHAEQLYLRALATREKVLGVGHPLVANTLDNLAKLYQDKGDYARAEPLFQRALAIREKALGAEHSDVARSLNNLASLYKAQGEYLRAEPLYQRSLAILEKAFGAEHPLVASALGNLAALYEAQGDYARAVELFGRCLEVREHNLSLILATGSENQKQLYLNKFAGESDGSVSMHVRSAPTRPEAAQLAVTTILRRKGRSLDAMTDQVAALRRHTTPQDQALLDSLSASRAYLATLQVSGRGNLTPEVRRERIARLEAEVERLEGEIGKRSIEFRTQAQPITLAAMQQALPADAALVEIFVYRPLNLKAKNKAEKYDAARYVAYVVRRGEAVPQWVELGETATIDGEVERLRAALKDPGRADVQTLARALDERVMRPIRKLLGPIQRIFLSPDGALNLIPFAALVDENSKYLVENYSIGYLTSGRDLLRLQARFESRNAPLLIADPLFDTAAMPPRPADRQVNQRSSQSDDSNRRSLDFTSRTYKPLPGTAAEAAALSKLLLDARVLAQEQATEAALKQVNRPRLLHIATHGFFLADQPQDLPTSNILRGTSDTLGTATLPVRWENPLLRSGLVLAGVKQGQSGVGEDGVLTALETAGLDLWGTKLVVLSACETGLGDVKNGAGVYGLRRALVLAGSETQVMSLWKVSDAGTRDLMTAYYIRLQKEEGRTEALRQVQMSMLHGQLSPAAISGKRETSDTDEKVVSKDYRHPYYWAAFIPSGDWRSLDGN